MSLAGIHIFLAPCVLFSYDNLDRLTDVDYGIDVTDEVFAMDMLGNRTSVDVRDGNTVTYDVDSLTNRYDSVGPNNLSYDAAGNLTKDRDSYTYHYDYENRIIKIKKSNDSIPVAEYSYDALGRRIRRINYYPAGGGGAATTQYYYSNNWNAMGCLIVQVLKVWQGSDIIISPVL